MHLQFTLSGKGPRRKETYTEDAHVNMEALAETRIDPRQKPLLQQIFEGSWMTQAVSLAAELLMMLLIGGRERTREEYRRLFSAAGLRLNRIIPTASEVSILEGFRA